MELCYEGAMVIPKNFVAIESNEMEYIDGGINTWQKIAIVAGVVVVAAALTVALVYGQLTLAATIMKKSIGAVVKGLGVKAVATLIASTLGVSLTFCTAALILIM